jgi:hypothetical protein
MACARSWAAASDADADVDAAVAMRSLGGLAWNSKLILTKQTTPARIALTNIQNSPFLLILHIHPGLTPLDQRRQWIDAPLSGSDSARAA